MTGFNELEEAKPSKTCLTRFHAEIKNRILRQEEFRMIFPIFITDSALIEARFHCSWPSLIHDRSNELKSFYSFLCCLLPQHQVNRSMTLGQLPKKILRSIRRFLIAKLVDFEAKITLPSSYPYQPPLIELIRHNCHSMPKVFDSQGFYPIHPIDWTPTLSLVDIFKSISIELLNETHIEMTCVVCYLNSAIHRSRVFVDCCSTTVIAVLEVIKKRLIRDKRLSHPHFHLEPRHFIKDTGVTLERAGFNYDCTFHIYVIPGQ